MESVYKTQCKTYALACALTNDFSDVSTIQAAFRPPFCLRILKPYRTEEMQLFRANVAAKMKAERQKH